MAPTKEFRELKEYLEGKFTDTKRQISELTESLDKTTAALQHSVEVIENDIHELQTDRDKMRSHIETQERRIGELTEQVLALDLRSRRQNLKFTDVTEELNQSPEKCLIKFLQEALKLDTTKLQITSAFRVGKLSYATRSAVQRPRPIIASFGDLDQVRMIKQAAYSRPKGSKGGIEPDLPKQMAEARQAAYVKFIKPAKREGK